MTSIVTDILNSAGALSREDIPTKVGNLRKKIDDVKSEVQEILKNRYIDFIPQYVKLDKVTGILESAESEYENLEYHIEKEIKPKMKTSVTEYQEMFEDMKRIAVMKKGLCHLITLYKTLEAVDKKSLTGEYSNAAENVVKFDSLFKEVVTENFGNVKIVQALNSKSVGSKVDLVYRLFEFWNKKIVINDLTKLEIPEFEIVFDIGSSDEVTDVIFALNTLNELNSILRTFGKTFLKLISDTVISNETDIKVNSLMGKTVISVSTAKSRDRPTLKSIFKCLSELFQNINSALFQLPYSKSNPNDPLMLKFGIIISKEFSELLINKCLKPSVPNRSDDLKDFEIAVNDVIDFQQLLLELSFFSTQDNPLMVFIQNVDHLPAQKMSHDLLRQSRELMKRDLHKTIDTGTEAMPFRKESCEEHTGSLSVMINNNNVLSRESFAFPSCRISESTQDLVNLLYRVMKEAKDLQARNPFYALKLYFTVRSICEMYCCVVPTCHKEEITNIPQQTAIHHNNCMYIAHCLLTIGARSSLNLELPVTFCDVAQDLKSMGAEAFLSQMRLQRQTILQLLKDPRAFENVIDEDHLSNGAEKAVRQCLQQLELLKRVWSEVLPIEVYFKAIGTLLNTFLEEIIVHILAMEDIAAKMAAQFDTIFDIVLRQSPQLFVVENRGNKVDLLHKNVNTWFKFQELQLVLSANLKDIVDRWSSGKGPLASHFKSDEVKHLIRALFQNTDRRAAALGKIR